MLAPGLGDKSRRSCARPSVLRFGDASLSSSAVMETTPQSCASAFELDQERLSAVESSQRLGVAKRTYRRAAWRRRFRRKVAGNLFLSVHMDVL